MRKFAVAALAVALLVPPAAQAAEITVQKDKTGRPMVVLNGRIETGDFNKFVKITAKLPAGTIVGLNSEGGVIVDAINIGHTVRNKRFLTVAGSACISACTFIWLAGVERGAFDDSSIGFHSVYTLKENGEAQVDGAGNAVVGAYLTKLGFGYSAIIYFTQTAPESAEWLSSAKAKELGIKVTQLKGTKKQAAAPEPQMKTNAAMPQAFHGEWCGEGGSCPNGTMTVTKGGFANDNGRCDLKKASSENERTWLLTFVCTGDTRPVEELWFFADKMLVVTFPLPNGKQRFVQYLPKEKKAPRYVQQPEESPAEKLERLQQEAQSPDSTTLWCRQIAKQGVSSPYCK